MSPALRRTAIIWAGATLLMLPAFVSGHVISDNSFLNVNWSQGFAAELFAGHLFPHWLPAMNGGAGSPVFFFYGPLPFYLTSPFVFFLSPRLAVVFGMWLMLALSGQAFYALAASIVRSNAALVSAGVYMAMPYHLLVDIWLRSDFGELTAYIFMPLSVLCALRLNAGQVWMIGLAFSLGGLLVCHLPSAVLFFPFLLGLCVYRAWQEQRASILVRAFIAVSFSFGLAAFYVVPALLLQHLIHAEIWTSTIRPSGNLLFSANPLPFELLLNAIVVSAVLNVATIAVSSTVNNYWRPVGPWVSASISIFLLVSPAAAEFWNLLPTLFDKVQYAWRALMLLDLAFCVLFAMMLDAKIAGRILIICLMTFSLGAVTAVFFYYRSREGDGGLVRRSASLEDSLILRRVEPLEYLPSCGPISTSERSNGKSGLIVHGWLGKPTSDEIAVFYYPFLDVTVNGRRVRTTCDSNTGFTVVGPHSGNVDVRIQTPREELMGDALSLSSLLFLLLNFISLKFRRQRSASI